MESLRRATAADLVEAGAVRLDHGKAAGLLSEDELPPIRRPVWLLAANEEAALGAVWLDREDLE